MKLKKIDNRKHYVYYTDNEFDGLIESLIRKENEIELNFYSKKHKYSLLIEIENWNFLKIIKLLKQNKFKFKKYLNGIIVYLDNSLKVLIYPEKNCSCCSIIGKKHSLAPVRTWAFKTRKRKTTKK